MIVRMSKDPAGVYSVPVLSLALLFDNEELGLQSCCRVLTRPNIESSWFNSPSVGLRIPVLEFVFSKRELQCLRLAGVQSDAFETFQLAYGA